ncbi:MAG: hypothetical protein ACOCUU_01385 [Nanoarchaeota archaeon]
MPKCSYCGKTYDIPYGLTLVLNDGNVKHLCSSKCRKNMSMNRRKVNWISKRKETKKEIKEEIKAEAKQQEQESQEMKETEKKATKTEDNKKQ